MLILKERKKERKFNTVTVLTFISRKDILCMLILFEQYSLISSTAHLRHNHYITH